MWCFININPCVIIVRCCVRVPFICRSGSRLAVRFRGPAQTSVAIAAEVDIFFRTQIYRQLEASRTGDRERRKGKRIPYELASEMKIIKSKSVRRKEIRRITYALGRINNWAWPVRTVTEWWRRSGDVRRGFSFSCSLSTGCTLSARDFSTAGDAILYSNQPP